MEGGHYMDLQKLQGCRYAIIFVGLILCIPSVYQSVCMCGKDYSLINSASQNAKRGERKTTTMGP